MPPLSGEQAAALYECFLHDTIELIRAARQHCAFTPIMTYLPREGEDYFRTLAPEFELLLQEGKDLSERLSYAITHCLTNGYDQAVIMDSDSPTLPVENLCRAFVVLDRADVDISLGPCDDGGYYLIGLKHPEPDLFLNVTMSTPQVVQDTLSQAHAKRLNVEMLPMCYDIDYVTDLQRMVDELAASPSIPAAHTRAFLAAHPVIQEVG